MQVNSGKAMKTAAEIRQIADAKGIQEVAMQEPYTVKGKVAGFGSSARVLTGEKRGETAWAALVIFDPKLVVMRIDQLSDSHIVCAQIDDGRMKLYVVSGYLQYSHSRNTYLDRLEYIVRHLDGHRILICIDANARSPMWHAEDLTNEGEEVESLITELNLYVVNEANEASTYSRPGGESNIDITLVTEQLFRKTRNWKVREGWVSSDHNAITFEVAYDSSRMAVMEKMTEGKFLTRKAKWEQFDKALGRKLAGTEAPVDKMETIQLARKLRRALVESCKESMPTKGKPRACARWWSSELTDLKSEVHKRRREFQRVKKLNCNIDEVELARREYHTQKRRYDKEIFSARVKSWK